jgi:L-ascorbate metabolism protein UlaG (beta-lactamase superfamily)
MVLRGLTGSDPRTHDWVAIDVTTRDVRIKTVRSFHDDAKGAKRGKNAIFVFEFPFLDPAKKARVVHLGDLGHETLEDTELVKGANVLLIPTGGAFTIDAAQAKKVVQALEPAVAVVPMHYKTDRLPPDLPLAPVDDFVKLCEGWLPVRDVRKTDGNYLGLNAEAKHGPIVYVMGFEAKK